MTIKQLWMLTLLLAIVALGTIAFAVTSPEASAQTSVPSAGECSFVLAKPTGEATATDTTAAVQAHLEAGRTQGMFAAPYGTPLLYPVGNVICAW